MREAVRHNLPRISAPCDVLLIARTATRSASYAEVERAVTDLLDRAQVCEGTGRAMADDAPGGPAEGR
jgi:RNase P protein component